MIPQALIWILLACWMPTAMAEEHGHGHEHEGQAAVSLSAAQVRAIGLSVEKVSTREVASVVRAPGQVAFNAYAMADVTARVEAVVVGRHVRLGDWVAKGAALVELESPAFARAQADYLRLLAETRRAEAEYRRAKALAADKIVSQARLNAAESADLAAKAELASAKAALAAYGLDAQGIERLPKTKSYGHLIVRAPIAGRVLNDRFRLGQHVRAGEMLLQIVDESTVWVDVRVPAVERDNLQLGSLACIRIAGLNEGFAGKVIAIGHELDPATRTLGIRLEVENGGDRLHAGMFVEAEVARRQVVKGLFVPARAVQRQGGETIVFVEEEPGHYVRREVVVGERVLEWARIREGLSDGERIVVDGAFALAAELAKGGFAVHNH